MGLTKSKHKSNSENTNSHHKENEDSPTGGINFNSFKILRSIGKGAFGKVCIVQKLSDSKMYAMKYMNKALCQKTKSVNLVIEEVSILQNIKNKFIVNLWYTFQDEEDLFIVVDLMLGGDLNYHINKQTIFTEKTIMIYMLQLGVAIDYLHSKLIIHRDIKPENILLDDKGILHLTDFNIAKQLTSPMDRLCGFAGTKPYAAPEVFQSAINNELGYSFQSDWWSLAVTMYELLRGKRPFRISSETPFKDCIEIFNEGEISFSADWSQPLLDVFLELFIVNCDARISSVAQLLKQDFCSEVKSIDEIYNLQPEFKPSTKRLNYDPSHELEEMLIENKPLHKKKNRLKKQHSKQEFNSEASVDTHVPDFPTYQRET